jgi:hypothetical protein
MRDVNAVKMLDPIMRRTTVTAISFHHDVNTTTLNGLADSILETLIAVARCHDKRGTVPRNTTLTDPHMVTFVTAAAAALRIAAQDRMDVGSETIMTGTEKSVENHLIDCAVLVARITVRSWRDVRL